VLERSKGKVDRTDVGLGSVRFLTDHPLGKEKILLRRTDVGLFGTVRCLTNQEVEK